MKLAPNRHDEKTRSIALELREWDKALGYSRSAGYFAPDAGGMTKDAVRSFVQALRSAAQVGTVAETDRGWVEKLLAFLDGHGRGGFGFSRQWKSWRRA